MRNSKALSFLGFKTDSPVDAATASLSVKEQSNFQAEVGFQP